MCDRQYYDEDIQQMCCPDQPICASCWRDRRAERRKEIDVEIEEHIKMRQAQGLIPTFKEVRPERAKRAEAPNVPVMPPGVASVYELTLTSPDDDVYYLRQSLQKIVESAMFEVKKWEACIELTKAGLPHIHAILYSSRQHLDSTKIKTKFKHLYELKRVRSLNNYLNYIKKENGNPSILAYCEKKGIPQFWDGPNLQEKDVEEKK